MIIYRTVDEIVKELEHDIAYHINKLAEIIDDDAYVRGIHHGNIIEAQRILSQIEASNGK